MSFRRVFTQEPGANILGNIESINTIDLSPPATPLGAGVGVTCIVGEFEDGAVESPRQVFGGADLEANFGGFGFEKNGTLFQLPVAVQSAGSDAKNTWNGNGFINLRNKRFAGLVVCRVDNSPGDVTASRLACATGGIAPFDMEPSQTLGVSLDGAATLTGTFLATASSILGVSGTFPTLFTGGETLELSIDGGTTVVVTFTAADQTLQQVIDRINSSTASSNPFIAFDTGSELDLRSRNRGYASSIEVVGGNSRATLGLPTAAVPQVDTFTVDVAPTGVSDTYTARVAVIINGVSTNFDATFVSVTGSETVTVVRDALLVAFLTLAVPGITFIASGIDDLVVVGDANVPFTSTVEAEPNPSDMTIALTTPITLTLVLGTGNVANIDLVSQAEVDSIMEAAVAGSAVSTTLAGNLRICNTATPLTGTILIDIASTGAAALGFTTGVTTAANNSALGDTTIPAGTQIQDTTTSAIWITLETTTVSATQATTLALKVRPAVDDDTSPTTAIGDLTLLLDTLPEVYAFTNATVLNRLTAPQMDVKYLDAIQSTIDVTGVGFDINIIYSARTSERIMEKLRSNALDATASGHRARKAVVSPLIDTSRVDAKAATGTGVGNVGREQRVFYLYPGLTTFIPEIASLGTLGGPGFTDDGVINVRSDGFYASVGSVLPPEENRGQQLSDTNYGPLNAISLEDRFNKAIQGGIGLTIDDYISFKASGIVAPISDRTSGLVFQSDVTSVAPTTQPSLVDAKRRFFGDFIIDSLGDIATGYLKKLNTPSRRRAFINSINSFLEILKAPNQPDTSRLEDYSVKDDTTTEQRAAGFTIIEVQVRIFASMDFIVFRTTVGTTVDVEEV